jgi:hypothetical protein
MSSDAGLVAPPETEVAGEPHAPAATAQETGAGADPAPAGTPDLSGAQASDTPGAAQASDPPPRASASDSAGAPPSDVAGNPAAASAANPDAAANPDSAAAADSAAANADAPDADAPDADEDQGPESDSYEDDDDDDDDDEPQLKYQRLGGDIGAILQKEAAACLAVHEKFLCCGTHEGSVHILDLAGNLIRSIAVHSTTVNDLSMDDTADQVASCSDDGRVVITNLFSGEAKTYTYTRPVKSVSLDPVFTRKGTGQFASGGLAGQLMLRTKGWLFSQKDQVLHKGEGPVTAVRWRGNLIAWANSAGVKVYDCKNNERISYIERDDRGTRPDLHRCHLFWERDDLLLMGWERSVKIARVREKPLSDITIGLPTRYVEIVGLFDTDYYICGLAPFEKRLVILGFVIGDDETAAAAAAAAEAAAPAAAGQQGAITAAEPSSGAKSAAPAPRPQLRVVTRDNDEICSDALEVRGFEDFRSLDYRLEHIPSESLFYIVSPRDIVVARPRDKDDHVAWLLERERYEEALRAIEEFGDQLHRHSALEVGERYLASLMQRGEFGNAAAMLPVIFKQDARKHWEKWIFVFHKMGQLRTVSPFIPTSSPTLSSTVYEMVLNEFLMRDPERFLRLVTQWPSELYSVKTIIDKVLARQRTPGSDSPVLMDALAALYTYERDYARTLEIYLRLKRPTVFSFIEEHNLFDSVDVKELIAFDPERAVAMFIERTDRVPVDEVVTQLSDGGFDRRHLHRYLHGLFTRDPADPAGRAHHGAMVALYADHDPQNLMPFLRQSSSYPLEAALQVCRDRNLHEGTVFILARMGNAKEALQLIIREIGSVDAAIDFVTEHSDDDLWADLITHSLSSPPFISGLLDRSVF